MRQPTGTRRRPGEKIVKDIKRATRRHYSSEEMDSIMLEIVTEFCITHNSLLASFFRDKVSTILGAIHNRVWRMLRLAE